jgi:D-glycero-D-manno-heptose 1,7-bisphosphate phosphatase
MNKALFLDRDGVINKDYGYLFKKEDFQFVEGIFELCQKAISHGYMIIIVTNQSGIAKGYYNESDFDRLMCWVYAQFKNKGISITDTFYCPHSSNQSENNKCYCRKPEPGLIFQAQQKYNLILKDCIFVGDKTSDMDAASNAGILKKILVASKYHDNTYPNATIVTNILTAIDVI